MQDARASAFGQKAPLISEIGFRTGQARWRVTAEIGAQLPLKLLGFVARMDLVARHISVASTADTLDIVILCNGISESSACIIAENMNAVVGVYSAELLWKPQ